MTVLGRGRRDSQTRAYITELHLGRNRALLPTASAMSRPAVVPRDQPSDCASSTNASSIRFADSVCGTSDRQIATTGLVGSGSFTGT